MKWKANPFAGPAIDIPVSKFDWDILLPKIINFLIIKALSKFRKIYNPILNRWFRRNSTFSL